MDTPWFRMMISRDYFKQILRVFHVVDNDTIPAKNDPTYRPSMRIRPLLDYLDVICMHYYYPNQAVSIDESVVAGKTRNPIRQYLPNKHHARFGTKIWLLADSESAYVLKAYIYEGAKYDPTSGIAGTGYGVVVRLMKMADLFHKGHHLYTDNLFTTFTAATYLFERGTFLTGTMRRNQVKYLPNEVITAKPKVGESVYFRQGNFLSMSYRQKQSQGKPLIMLSSFYGAYNVPHRKKEDKVIPRMVDGYNRNMGGVDSSDQVLYSYMSEQKSKSWSKKVVFNLLTRLLMNSYIHYSKTVEKPIFRIDFIRSVIDSLASDYKEIDAVPSSNKPGVKTLPLKKEKDCCICSNRKDPAVGRKRTKTVCNSCNKGLHCTCLPKHKCFT